MRKLTSFVLPISVAVLAMPGLATQAQAQGAQEDEAIEEIITTGLRGRPRSAVDSAVPIDTFDTDSIEAVARKSPDSTTNLFGRISPPLCPRPESGGRPLSISPASFLARPAQ